METKGAHLEGNEDTTYKRALLERLSLLYADRRQHRAGQLELTGANSNTAVVCDLLVDTAWQGTLVKNYFAGSTQVPAGAIKPSGAATRHPQRTGVD